MIGKALGGIVMTLVGVSMIARAQPPGQQPSGSRTGNPTPGTAQPDPPNLADRITVTGCIERVVTDNRPSRDASAVDPSTILFRYALTKAERRNVVPPGTGTSPLAASTKGSAYRLNGMDSQLSAFIGNTVEISGEVEIPGALEPRAPTDANAGLPILRVEFVQRLAAGCR